MKKMRISLIIVLSATLILSGCASWNKTQKGAVVGTAAGGAMGAVIGRASGNTALGAIIGAAVGGGAGAIIGEGIVVEFSSNVLFAFDKSNLSDDAKTNLTKLVKVLNSYPDTNIEVQGHTDSKGSESYNQKLSVRRATEVSAYLDGNGIKTNRVNIKGFGESAPKYENDTDQNRSKNRRVEFLIAANEKMKAEAAKEAGK
jgi:outer membrane protein OmpA-like peptidoglycan-associated protein